MLLQKVGDYLLMLFRGKYDVEKQFIIKWLTTNHGSF